MTQFCDFILFLLTLELLALSCHRTRSQVRVPGTMKRGFLSGVMCGELELSDVLRGYVWISSGYSGYLSQSQKMQSD